MKLISILKEDLFYSKTKLFWLVLLFFITVKTHRTYVGQGDEPHYMIVTESLYLDHDLDVSNNYHSPWLLNPMAHHAVVMPNGKEIPLATVGLPILEIPIFALAHIIVKIGMSLGRFQKHLERGIFFKNAFSFSMMVVGSFFSVYIFQILFSLTQRRKLSWTLALLFSISPPLAIYGLLVFSDFPAGILLIILFWNLYQKKPLSWQMTFILGFLPWLHSRLCGPAVVFLFLFMLQSFLMYEKFNFRVFLFKQGPKVFLVIMGWIGFLAFNYHLWGSFYPGSHITHLGYKSFDPAYLKTSIPALFFDRSFGLFFRNPIYIFSLAGLMVFTRKNKFMAFSFLLLMASYLVGVSGFLYWWGGWSPGPRYLIPITPLLAIMTGLFINELWSVVHWRNMVVVGLALIFLWSFLYWLDPRLYWNQEDGVNLFINHWLGKFGAKYQDLLPNFFLPDLTPLIMAGFYCVVAIVINLFLYWDVRIKPIKS